MSLQNPSDYFYLYNIVVIYTDTLIVIVLANTPVTLL